MDEVVKCGQQTCDSEAKFRAFWPGRPPLPSCLPCTLKLIGVAQTLGFYLHVEQLLLPEKEHERT